MKLPHFTTVASWILITTGIGLAFYAGLTFVKSDVTPTLVTPSATPTPVPLIQLSVNTAYRISQPDQIYDYGIIDLTLASSNQCSTTECNFSRQDILLSPDIEDNVESFRPAAPPTFATSIPLIQLPNARQLGAGATETGQVYFLIPPDINQFTLTYQGRGDTPISFTTLE